MYGGAYHLFRHNKNVNGVTKRNCSSTAWLVSTKAELAIINVDSAFYEPARSSFHD